MSEHSPPSPGDIEGLINSHLQGLPIPSVGKSIQEKSNTGSEASTTLVAKPDACCLRNINDAQSHVTPGQTTSHPGLISTHSQAKSKTLYASSTASSSNASTVDGSTMPVITTQSSASALVSRESTNRTPIASTSASAIPEAAAASHHTAKPQIIVPIIVLAVVALVVGYIVIWRKRKRHLLSQGRLDMSHAEAGGAHHARHIIQAIMGRPTRPIIYPFSATHIGRRQRLEHVEVPPPRNKLRGVTQTPIHSRETSKFRLRPTHNGMAQAARAIGQQASDTRANHNASPTPASRFAGGTQAGRVGLTPEPRGEQQIEPRLLVTVMHRLKALEAAVSPSGVLNNDDQPPDYVSGHGEARGGETVLDQSRRG